ncbi:hypothetical protein AWB81_01782 [Caballeronia arationis]|uniref:hypothetical protein n=1 Tax=Caballeronia arationis TaxID=1777142 RepID=UPI00074B5703|nr:hypothetical protein [Caballeronia arationis]SAK59030.1 hypothetical protein AWB81_01782 [Caballeronia arationis]
MYPNHQMHLPVSADMIQRPFLSFSVQNPPFVPQIQIEPWLTGYVPLVAGMAAGEIQNLAESNPLRRFFFNLFSNNAFANDEFTALVKGILDYVVLSLAERPQMRPEQVIETSVSQIIELMVATMIKVYPPLRNYIPPQSQPAFDNHIRSFDAISNKIAQFRNQYGFLQAPPGQQQQQAFGGGYVPPQQGYVQHHPGGDPRFGNAGHHPYQPQGMTMPQQNGSIFNNGGMSVQQPVGPQGRSMGDRYANMPDMATPAAPPAQSYQAPVATVAQETITMSQQQNADGPLEDAETTSLKWTRSDHQPYHPAYNPVTHQLFYQRLANGTVNAVIKQRENIMDYDRHKTSSVFGPIPPALDLANTDQVMQNLSQGLKEIAEEKEARREEETPKFATRVRAAWYADTSVESCWLKGAIEWAKSTEDGKRPDIFRQYGQVVDATISLEDEAHFIEEFRDAGTFIQLKELLDDAYGEASTSLWYKANARATDMVNRVLSLNLALSGVSIDSFVHDIDELIQVLRDGYGDTILKAFVRNQRRLITATFEALPDEVQEQLTLDLIEDVKIDGEEPKLAFLTSNVSFTYLNCLSHELCIEFAKGETAVIMKSVSPVFHQLVKDIMDEGETFTTTVDRQLVQTLDGKILEVDVGFIGEEMYVVRLVK